MTAQNPTKDILDTGTYLVAGSGIIGYAMDLFDNHGTAIMAVIALATWISSLFFQLMHYRLKRKLVLAEIRNMGRRDYHKREPALDSLEDG